jgi:undecaprenyl-diphosphatase
VTLFEAIIIAIVEGLTEFLPISSTGHMIIAQALLGVENSDFVKAFVINIQFGAILSVVILYWKRFFQSIDFYYKLFVAFLPAVVFGLLLSDFIDELLESVLVVAIMLLLGGVLLIFIDKWLNPKREVEITYPKAFKIGLFQCIAMIPGVSRSAASIGASVYKLYKSVKTTPEIFQGENLTTLLVGNAVAFIVAMLAIKFFISFLTKYGFKAFGWYRVIVGAVLIILVLSGVNLSIL